MDTRNGRSQDLDSASSIMDGGPRTGLVIERSVVDSSIVILRPVGDLDMLTCPALRAQLHAELDLARHVTVDLTEVTFVASSALQVLLEAHELALSRDGGLRVAGAGRRHVLRPFEITGLDKVLTISAARPSPSPLSIGHPRGSRAPTMSPPPAAFATVVVAQVLVRMWRRSGREGLPSMTVFLLRRFSLLAVVVAVRRPAEIPG